jgi:flagellar biosynthesis protein FlhA
MNRPAQIDLPTTGVGARADLLLCGGMLLVLTVMIVPLPAFLLDLLLATNIAFTCLLLFVTLRAKKPLELAVFPSLLLLLTLFRLSLNVATTRKILLNGDAGQIVQAFGEYVVGGQLVIGLVIFLILVIVQFVVITKGAGRISEVAARFTLDALPGKQMAIDAELGARLIDEKQARSRRQELMRETEFYGAMDGASKFVRGDAVAGLIITALNLCAGFGIGLSRGMTFFESLELYSILTVGDGLVTQIPALIIATAAGMLVTKSSSDEQLGRELNTQLLGNARSLQYVASVMMVLSFVPGLPMLPFWSIAAATYGISRLARPELQAGAAPNTPDGAGKLDDSFTEADELKDFLTPDRAVVELGASTAALMVANRGLTLQERVTKMRHDLARSEGLWIPPIRIQDSNQLADDDYSISVAGRVVGKGTLHMGRYLAISSNKEPPRLQGTPTEDPVFGLPAVWIDEATVMKAKGMGLTVVDVMTVLITHLSELVRTHGHEMITREHVKVMLDQTRAFAPTVVDEVKSDTIRMSTLHQVIVQLAAERVPLSDLAAILEAILNHAPNTQNIDELVEKVRKDLGHLVCDRYLDESRTLAVVAFEPHLDALLREQCQQGALALAPQALVRLKEAVGVHHAERTRRELPIALLVSSPLRRPLRRLLLKTFPGMGIIAYDEIPAELEIKAIGVIRTQQIIETRGTAGPGGSTPASSDMRNTTVAA